MNIAQHLPENVRRELERLNNGEWEPQPIEVTFQCETCEDIGHVRYDVPVGHPWFGKMFPCPDCEKGQALLRQQWESRLKTAKVPDVYKHLTFESWRALPAAARKGKRLAFACAELFVTSPNYEVSIAEAMSRIDEPFKYADAVRNSLIFQGVPGLGKTGLASAITNHLLAEGKAVLYIRTHDLLESIKTSFDKDKKVSNDGEKVLSSTQQPIVSIVKRSPVLLLDEFNVSIVGDWRMEVMEDIIRYRHGNRLPTIFTCNANMDELERQWGIRTTSVLFAMAHFVPMDGPVLRDLRQVEKAI